MRSLKTLFTTLAGVVLFSPNLVAAEAETPALEAISVHEILVSDLIPLALPAFHDAGQAGVEWDDLLQEMPDMPGAAAPRENESFAGSEGQVEWQKLSSGDRFELKASGGSSARYLAFYVSTDRWQKISLEVIGDQNIVGSIGAQSLSFSSSESDEGSQTTHTADSSLLIGKHLVILRTMRTEESGDDWTFAINVTPSAENSLSVSIDPSHHVDIETVLNAPRVSSVSISPDGKLSAISLSEYRNGSDRERWLEVRETKSGKLVRLWRGDHAPGGVQWHPQGHRITWQTNAGDAGSLHTFDFNTGETEVVLADVAKLGGWKWAPNGKSIVFAVNRSPEPDPRKVKRVMYLADRQS